MNTQPEPNRFTPAPEQTDAGPNQGVIWTLQRFAQVAGKDWYALQKQNDHGVLWQFTGYRHEVDAVSRQHNITPLELPPTTQEEFLCRSMNQIPAQHEPDRTTTLHITEHLDKQQHSAPGQTQNQNWGFAI